MSINFNNGKPFTGNPSHDSKPKEPAEKKPSEDPQIKNLQKQKELIEKRIEHQVALKKHAVASIPRAIVSEVIGPNTDQQPDPMDLERQIHTILTQMGIANFTNKSKIELMPHLVKGGNQQYMVPLRREAVLDGDTIARIHRNKENLAHIEWTSNGICFYIWAPYNAEAV
jgi:hypothetical protein